MDGLRGRVALVTGVSRRAGIGFAVARRLLDDGASVFCHSWTPHDAEQSWGADPLGIEGVVDLLGHEPERVGHVELDLAEASNAAALMTRAVDRFGPVDLLIVNHARSSAQSLVSMTAEELDASWAVNGRASALLVQAFAAQHDDTRGGGRVVLFTSGQYRSPMSDELPYAISKGAIHQMTLSLADALRDRGITVNTVDPGPTDTGWASPETVARERWNTPGDVAEVVRRLVDADAAHVTGQVIDAERGRS